MHQNINGLINKADQLSVHLNELEKLDKTIDIICITEHNMNKEDHTFLTLSNYSLAASYARDNRNGGSCIIIKNGLKFQKIKYIEDLSIPNMIECCAIKLTEHPIVIVCVYRVPKYRISDVNIFLKALSDILNKEHVISRLKF